MNSTLISLVIPASVSRSLTPILFALALMVTLNGTSLSAQTIQQAGMGQPAQSQLELPLAPVGASRPSLRLERTFLGLGGEFAGLFAGGALGYALAGDCNSQREFCEWHGFGELLIGSLIGGVVGTAAGSSIAQGFGNCTRGRRFKRALVGATIGAFIGVPTLTVGEAGTTVIAALSAPAAAAYALKRC